MEFLDKYGDLDIDVSVCFDKYSTIGTSKPHTHSVSTDIEVHI